MNPETPLPNDTEHAKLALDQKRAQDDVRLREAELAFRKEEMHARLESEAAGRRVRFSPLGVALFSGALGLIGTGAGALLQGYSNMKLERQKFESQLIFKAIETGNPEAAAKNLLFMVKIGLIQDPTGKIGQLQASPHDSPVLPVVSQPATEMIRRMGLSVQAIQEVLQEEGIYTGPLSGLYDLRTSEAVKRFQKSRGMIVDGFIGPQTAIELKRLIEQRANK